MAKILNDSIHGIITLHPLLFKIIDTPQFQRLRDIKQLGGCYFVYPGASHNRFEHSIGTCYLASKLANQLQLKFKEDIDKMNKDDPEYSRLKEAEMTDKDKLCIEIAALCHDLGHGPFSHLFDQMFPKAMKKKDTNFKPWKHEEVSRKMFDYLIESNKSLKEEFEKDFTEKDVKMIKDLIDGKGKKDDPQLYKQYMYEIVANKQNEIDVDKMDYFARDCHGLGMTSNFDHLRFISQCRIMFPSEDSKQTTIAVRDKEELNLYELFHTRNGLFRRAYQHQVTHGIQLIKKELKMSEAFKNMHAYEKLTDSVVDVILMSQDEALKKAKDLIHRIYNRQLYKVVGCTEPKTEFKEEELKKYEKDLLKDEKQFGKDDFNLQRNSAKQIENIDGIIEDDIILDKEDIQDIIKAFKQYPELMKIGPSSSGTPFRLSSVVSTKNNINPHQHKTETK
ncbi:SAMHD1 [Mytilus coruscus]|uniref:SAMHD1 n=1 Tax=Mytilus coruscus TaxID=42192 RepID=A0A6J8BTW8_MYTCO|nr:SAMHD1 [Mytilus coruscus]